MFCRKCGKQIPDDSAFCYKCGVRVILNVSKSASDKPITLEKPEQKASGSLEDSFTPNVKEEVICPECGRKIPSLPCLYCIEENINILRNKGKMSMPNIASDVGTNTIEQLNDNSITLEKSPIPKTETYVSSEKLPENNEESQHRYKRALAALECSNDIDSLRRASDEFFALGAYLDSRKKSQDCKDKIYKIQNNVSTAIPRYDEQKAVKSSTSSASSTILENASLPNNNYSSSEEYASLKKGTLIALYVLMGIVVLFCMATGQLSFLGCPSLIEYEYEVSVSGMFTIFWWAIGLNIARAIFLGCCKAAHKNK